MTATSVPGAPALPSPTAELRDIVPPQPYHLPIQWMWIAAGAVAVLAIAFLLWRLLQRPAKPAPAISPREAAEARLRELRGKAATMEPRLFGVEVCDVLRVFLAGQFHLAAERQTSEEFLNSITDTRAFAPGEHQLLTEFLEQSDLLKFARQDAALPAKEKLLGQATQFIEVAAPIAAREEVAVAS